MESVGLGTAPTAGEHEDSGLQSVEEPRNAHHDVTFDMADETLGQEKLPPHQENHVMNNEGKNEHNEMESGAMEPGKESDGAEMGVSASDTAEHDDAGANDNNNDNAGNSNVNEAEDSTPYEYATNKGKDVLELTVVDKDGFEVNSPVAKRPRTEEANNEDQEKDSDDKDANEEGQEHGDGDGQGSNRKKKRLYFGRDKLIFVHMAQAYIKHELYKHDTPERWEAAHDEFYNKSNMDEVAVRKSVSEVKKPFLSGLESRIKALPKKVMDNESEEQTLCRKIKKLRDEAQQERIRNGEDEPENRKKRKRPGPETRGRPRISDIEMTPDMEQRYYNAEKVREEEKKAADAVTDIERQIKDLQRQLERAKAEQKAAAERAEKVSAEFSEDVIHGSGPWKDMFAQLKKYGEEHGTVNIIRGQTPEMKALRRWVLRQRERYHMNDDQRSKLPWYCAKNLESIGFLWRYSDGTWQKFYEELIEYKKEHGDCAVPRGYKPNPKLSQWVKRMRHEGNRFREDPSSVALSAQQYQMLLDIGFIWENLSRSWNERLEDLKKFKAEHGHCRVPKNYPANPKLVSWCQNQRAHHRAFLLGKKTFMDANRKKILEEVGFEWETGATPGRPPSSPDKKKRARKKKDDIREDSESEEEEMEVVNALQNGMGHEDEPAPQFATAPPFAAAPPYAPPQVAAQVFQNHPFAHPNHAYANPYHQQQQPHQHQQHHQPQHLQQPRHFFPTL